MLLPEPMPGWNNYAPMKMVTVSTLRAFSRCPRYYFYNYGVDLEDAAGPHPALKFGEAIHKALGIMASTDNLGQALLGFRDVWQNRDDIGDEKRNTQQAVKVLMDYQQNHGGGKSLYIIQPPPSSHGLIQADDQTSDFEVPFAIDLGLALPFCGRIDGLVRHRDSGEYWGLEWKTTSEMGARFLNGFTLNSQVIGYTTALRALYPQLKIRGFMVEGLFVGVKSQNMLIPIYVDDHLCDDFIQQARYKTAMILQMQEMKNFPKDFTGCNSYDMFGQPGYMCNFQRLCTAPDWTALANTYVRKEQKYSPFQLTVGGKEVATS